tara:strand:+ start:27091 stop:27495 length:405 start_codon:yes stop_codon:yes gene_type:complete
MITTGNLPEYENCIYNIDLTVDSPESGFEFSILSTGLDSSTLKTSNLISFSGKEGYLFDQSGNFFGGYRSGEPFNLEIHHDFTNKTFSYYSDKILIANSLDTTGIDLDHNKISHISFTKHGNSILSLNASGSIS